MIAPVFKAKSVSQMVEVVTGTRMAAMAFEEGHRGRVPKVEHAKPLNAIAEARRDRVLRMRLDGLSVKQISQKVRAKACTVKHDMQVLRQRGLLPENMPRKVA